MENRFDILMADFYIANVNPFMISTLADSDVWEHVNSFADFGHAVSVFNQKYNNVSISYDNTFEMYHVVAYGLFKVTNNDETEPIICAVLEIGKRG